MKKIFTTSAIVLAVVVVVAPEVRADPPRWGVTIGFGRDGAHVGFEIGRGHRSRCRPEPPVCYPRGPVCLPPPPPPVHVHAPVPVVRDVWVPARFESVFVGYDWCGRPIYRSVCVSPGRYERVVVGYRCAGCDCSL